MAAMRVIVCGSRSWTDRWMVSTVLDGLLEGDELTIVEGCAPGADRFACGYRPTFLRRDSVRHEHHPADWEMYGNAAGPMRNQEMADAGAGLCVAFTEHPPTPGTADMVRRAKRAGIPVWVFGHGLA